MEFKVDQKVEDETNDWLIDCDRFVALVDIMGFKNMVAREDHSIVKLKLKTIIEANNLLSKADYTIPIGFKLADNPIRIFKSITFSDSILFVTKGNSNEDLISLLRHLSGLMLISLATNIPLKGALSKGFFTFDSDQSIYFGQPLIDAFIIQQDLYFYGIVIDNLVESIIINLMHGDNVEEIKLINKFISQQFIPFKNGKIKHYIIKPGKALKGVREKMLEDLYRTVSGNTRKYVDNTIDMYNLLQPEEHEEN